jgi:hypothetical protein
MGLKAKSLENTIGSDVKERNRKLFIYIIPIYNRGGRGVITYKDKALRGHKAKGTPSAKRKLKLSPIRTKLYVVITNILQTPLSLLASIFLDLC